MKQKKEPNQMKSFLIAVSTIGCITGGVSIFALPLVWGAIELIVPDEKPKKYPPIPAEKKRYRMPYIKKEVIDAEFRVLR